MVSDMPKSFQAKKPEQRQRTYANVLRLVAFCFFVVWSGLYMFTGEASDRISAAREEYGRVLPLVTEMNALRAQRGDLGQLETGEAVARIAATLGLDHGMVRLEAQGESPDQEELAVNGLTLPQLVALLGDLRVRGGFQTVNFSLSRNPRDERLADVRMVLER